MASFLVIILLFIANSFAQSDQSWEQGIKKKYNADFRIAFGQAELGSSEVDSIDASKKKALFELGKTFRVRVSGSSVYESINSLSNGSTNKQNSNVDNLSENVERVNLVGVDQSNVDVDREKNIVSAAAIINLKDFEAYLRNQLDAIVADIKKGSLELKCKAFEDLKMHRLVSKKLDRLKEYSLLLQSIRPGTFSNDSLTTETDSLISQCRKSFAFNLTNIDPDLFNNFSKIITNEGFAISNKANSSRQKNQTFELLTKKQFSEPKNMFNRMNIVGGVEVELYNQNVNRLKWKSNTLRSSDSSLESATTKLNIRLNDEAVKGLKELLEVHF